MRDLEKRYQDFELVARLRASNRLAFEEVFERYHRVLFRFLYKKTQEEDVSKDIVQDVFIRLWNNRTQLDARSNIRSYLFRMAHNGSLDWFRSQRIRSDYAVDFQRHMDLLESKTDHLIREKDMQAIIEAEVAALPDRMQTVINLRRFHHLSNREISVQLGISEQTVETHFKRAFRVLRRRLLMIVPLSILYLWWIS